VILRAVGDATRQPHVVVGDLGLNGGNDPVHRIDAVKVIGGDDHGAVGMLQRRGETAADHIAQHVEDHHIGVFQQVMLFQQLDGLAHDIAAAAGAGGRAAGLDTHDPVVADGHEILGAQFLGVEIDILEDVDDGGLQVARSG
jgi:hypothetical protein